MFDGRNVPAPPDQIPPVAPETLPVKVTVGFVAQSVWSAPALAIVGTVIAVTETDALTGGQLEVSLTNSVYIPAPVVMLEVVAPVFHK